MRIQGALPQAFCLSQQDVSHKPHTRDVQVFRIELAFCDLTLVQGDAAPRAPDKSPEPSSDSTRQGSGKGCSGRGLAVRLSEESVTGARQQALRGTPPCAPFRLTWRYAGNFNEQ